MFLADENVESLVVQRLRSDGHDVLWIAESAPALPTIMFYGWQRNRIGC